jgi:hypothetical protein
MQSASPAVVEEESSLAAPAPCGQDPECESPCCYSSFDKSWMSHGFLQPICPNVNMTSNEQATYAPPVDGAFVPMRVGLINATPSAATTTLPAAARTPSVDSCTRRLPTSCPSSLTAQRRSRSAPSPPRRWRRCTSSQRGLPR